MFYQKEESDVPDGVAAVSLSGRSTYGKRALARGSIEL
jgi:hypothetical protein